MRCRYYVKNQRGCSRNNAPYDMGECIYKNGEKMGNEQLKCPYYEAQCLGISTCGDCGPDCPAYKETDLNLNTIAINRLRIGNDSREHRKLAIRALEKQVPSQPIHKSLILYTIFLCSICETRVGNNEDGDIAGYDYCPNCGQKIDWE